MKKMILEVMVLGLLATSAHAGLKEVLEKVNWRQGVAYSFADSNLNAMSTFDVATWKSLRLSLGYAGDSDSTDHKAIANLSVSILRLKDFGVTVPILDLVEIEPGIWFGAGRWNFKDLGETETDYGVSLSLINLKF